MGLILATSVLVVWAGHLFYALAVFDLSLGGGPGEAALTAFRVALHMLVQGYLYTGLFITAHDAMHQSVCSNKRVNRVYGTVAAALFAAFSYKRLLENHFKHHRRPGGDRDPDFFTRSQAFVPWFVTFFTHYVTVVQFLVMALLFNLLIRFVPVANVVVFWVVPAFLGTLQLFYFGTYLPHRRPHTQDMEPHKARSQRRNHPLAMLSCYFFGYHYEHHESPGTPWWKLHELKR